MLPATGEMGTPTQVSARLTRRVSDQSCMFTREQVSSPLQKLISRLPAPPSSSESAQGGQPAATISHSVVQHAAREAVPPKRAHPGGKLFVGDRRAALSALLKRQSAPPTPHQLRAAKALRLLPSGEPQRVTWAPDVRFIARYGPQVKWHARQHSLGWFMGLSLPSARPCATARVPLH